MPAHLRSVFSRSSRLPSSRRSLRRLPVLALLVAGVAAVSVGSPPDALAGRSPVAREIGVASKTARRTFQLESRAAFKTLRTATSNFSTGLTTGDQSVANAVQGYSAALATYLTTLRTLAEDASTSVADAAAGTIADFDATADRDALAGGGGALDKFGDQMQAELDRAHRRVVANTRRYLATVERATGRDAGTSSFIRRLEFGERPVPLASGALSPGARPLRLDMVVTVRLASVGVVVTAAGSADAALDGQFDVRLINPAHVAVGEFLSDGGVAVAADGSWLTTDTLGTPGGGLAFPAGNRTIQFGVEPFDGGLAGMQPSRLVHAGAIGIK